MQHPALPVYLDLGQADTKTVDQCSEDDQTLAEEYVNEANELAALEAERLDSDSVAALASEPG